MSSLTDNFARENEPLETDGAWRVLNEDGLVDDAATAASEGLEVFQRYATNQAAKAVVGVLLAATPESRSQEVAVFGTSTAESADNFIDAGIGGDDSLSPLQNDGDPFGTVAEAAGTSPSLSWQAGVWARLHWQAGGVRTLSIMHKLRGGVVTVAESANVVLSGGIAADGYDGRLTAQGALGELQQLRLVVTTDAFGMLARAYLNETDDDHPTLTARIVSDFVPPTDDATDFGSWWFGFGGAAARTLAIGDFFGADYDASVDSAEPGLRQDQVTLAELRKRVRIRYERSRNTALADEVVDEAIRDTLNEILLELGDSPFFLIRNETLSLTPTTGTRTVTLDPKMARVLGVYTAATFTPVESHFLYVTDAGAPVVQLAACAGSYVVRYVARYREMGADHDVCPLPRQYTEAVVVGACLRLAETDRKDQFTAYCLSRFEHFKRLLLLDQGRYRNSERRALQPVDRSRRRYL